MTGNFMFLAVIATGFWLGFSGMIGVTCACLFMDAVQAVMNAAIRRLAR